MGKREDAARLLRSGVSPGAIRQIQEVSLSTILGYLEHCVGRGQLRRSDILFAVPVQIRCEVSRLISEKTKFCTNVQAIADNLATRGIEADTDDIAVALRYRDASIALGDMYEDIAAIETYLHRLIRASLEKNHGKGEMGWWRKGVPLPIRQKCLTRREEDQSPVDDPYAYTDLLDLCKICEKEWNTVNPELPKAVASNRKQFINDLDRLNRIRRMVMHPVRGMSPSEDDFQFVHTLKVKLGLLDRQTTPSD